jgi:arsenite-transporting ATPase
MLFVGGKGGVGKTTVACATALRRARACPDARGLLLSTDPAHSLADRLDGADVPPNLDVDPFDADAAMEAFRAAHRDTVQAIAAHGTFFSEDEIGPLLDLALPGLDEVMAALRLADLADPDADVGARYAWAVVDTAPTGHTLRLLDTPDAIGTWTHFLDTMLAKHRQMRTSFGGGASGPDDMDAFVADLEARAEALHEALRDPARTRFLVVTQPEPVVLDETAALLDDLRTRDVPVAGVVVNRLAGEGTDAGRAHRRALAARPDALDADAVWRLPDLGEAALDGEALADLWTHAAPLDPGALASHRSDEAATSKAAATDKAPAVEAPLPLPEGRLVLVAGKGGVGKTTVACATALRLAAEGRAVHLLSTDPAHSLAAVLNRDVGAEAADVAPGLVAQAVDAAARFDDLRQTYAEEVARLFDRRASGFEATLDRAVMEGLMDLAPPGLDEVMGWDVALDALDDADVLVLDAAPTGHFLRLMETPEHMRAWLRGFFRILRRYRNVLRLPTLNDRLVRLSKRLRHLHECLVEEQTGSVLVVAAPSRLALSETRDLVARCQSLGARVHGLALNHVTDAAHDADARRAFADAFPDLRQAVIRRHAPPTGLETLRALGMRLFA